MENEIIYVEDPRMVLDYCRKNVEEQAMLKIIADEFIELAGKCGAEIMTKAKVNADIKMLVSELNKRNRNGETIVIDTVHIRRGNDD